MRKIFKYSILSVIILASHGCGKDYLETEPTENFTQKQIGEAAALNPAVVAGTMKGIYAFMYTAGTGGTGGHYDFGQKSYDLFMDILSADMAYSANSWNSLLGLANLSATVDFTSNYNYAPWRHYYRMIRSSNLVIDALGGQDVVPELLENRFIMGQAKAMRAHSYFYLTQLYTKEFNATAEILPIYTNSIQENQPKSTTQEVYDLILSDLTDAMTLLEGYTRPSKVEVDQNLAKMMLAYVYAYLGNYPQAKVLTDQVILAGGYPLTSVSELTGGFNDVNTGSWMWGMDLTSDQGLGLISWWGQMDLFTYSYQVGDYKSIDRVLYDAIPANDVRKNQFSTYGNYNYLMPINKFYHPDRVQDGQGTITTDYVYMRIEEAYLLNAEAAAKSGDEIMARNRLKALLQNRIPDVSYIDGLTLDELKDEIYLQTRIELWGEGRSYLAMKRNKAVANRSSNHLFFPNTSFPYNDGRLTLEIPQSEIQNNPYIEEGNN